MTAGDRPVATSTEHDLSAGLQLKTITDDMMRDRLTQAKPYTVALLRKTSSFRRPEVDPIIWEHGRRNIALGEHGVLAIVMPVTDDAEWAGVGVFNASPEQVSQILDEDPGVQAGIFTYEVHPVRGFPGSSLPA